MTDTDLDVEPCAWRVGSGTWWRTCEKPSTSTVTDGRLTARVCPRHRVRALEQGWHDNQPPLWGEP